MQPTNTLVQPTESLGVQKKILVPPTKSPLHPSESLPASSLIPVVAAVVSVVVMLLIVVITIVAVIMVYLRHKSNKISAGTAFLSPLGPADKQVIDYQNPEYISGDYIYSVVDKSKKASATLSVSSLSTKKLTDVQETNFQNPQGVVGDYTYSVVDKKLPKVSDNYTYSVVDKKRPKRPSQKSVEGNETKDCSMPTGENIAWQGTRMQLKKWKNTHLL